MRVRVLGPAGAACVAFGPELDVEPLWTADNGITPTDCVACGAAPCGVITPPVAVWKPIACSTFGGKFPIGNAWAPAFLSELGEPIELPGLPFGVVGGSRRWILAGGEVACWPNHRL